MAHLSSDCGPSDQSSCFDHSHHETSIGNYTNRGQHASQGGIIYNINQYNSLKELEKRCSHNAAFDSAARSNPPRCAESTRLQIIQIIEEWINSDEDAAMPSNLFWLHGGAGVGKSALAQSLSEDFHKKSQLAASFFFFRSDPARNNGNQLIPTLVSHLIRSLKAIIPFVDDCIRENPPLFTKRHEIQIQGLLVEPLLALRSKGSLVAVPRLIVIDGLDECENQEVQCVLLRAIASAIPQIPYPLRFLITSRPEAHITDVFNHDPDLQAIAVHRYNLSDDPDADMDIRKFLEKEFAAIRQVHRLGQNLPLTWPDRKAIASLVERSSRHFIYASTVIRYIQSPKHRPDDRLEVILRLQPPRDRDRPYAQLDALYALIFQCVDTLGQLEKICLVLGILYFESKSAGVFKALTPDVNTIERLLEMKAGDLVLLLDPILSLISIDVDRVRILHKSLFDYLLDSTRGGHLPFDLARVHELAAMYILDGIVKGVCEIHNIRDLAYHCQYGYLNDTLRIYLQSLELTSLLQIEPWSDLGLSSDLPLILWSSLRTLSREEFDSTRRVHEQYAVRWTRCFQSPVRDRKQSQVRRNVDSFKSWLKLVACLTASLPQGVEDSKRQLDALLMEWKPQNFKPNIGVNLNPDVRAASIKHEHNVFSALSQAEASLSLHTDANFSSLVFGDHFIHSYNCRMKGQDFYLSLHTYSRHDDRCHRIYLVVPAQVIVQETLRGLKIVELYLFSDLYQKYGLEPDISV